MEVEFSVTHRTVGYNYVLISQWMEQVKSDQCITWARKSYAQMAPFFAPGRYVNYLGHDEASDQTALAYGSNYRRLQELKSKYDPNNFFHMNQNIHPAA